jgi:molybdopterin-guanine dinucleotide biosynthesis protein A
MTGVVLAGGMGRRLGQPKALADLDGYPLIQHVLKIIKPLFTELLIVADRPEKLLDLGIRVVADTISKSGPLGGIYSGLCKTSTPRVFCFACDMPFLNPDLIQYMIDNCGPWDAFVPRYAQKLHPLHAIYSQDCREAIKSRLLKRDLKIVNFFSGIRVGYVSEDELACYDPAGYALFNVNTGSDLKLAHEIARRINH